MSIQLRVEPRDLVLVILGLELVLWHIDDGVIFFDLQQHLFAVERDLVIVRVAQDGLLAIVHVVNAKVRFPVSVGESFFVIFADVISRCAAQIKDPPVIQHSDVAIISRCNFQPKDPVLDSIGIHFHNDRLLWFFFRLLPSGFFFRFFFFGFLRFFLLSFFFSLADFIALRGEGVRGFFGKRDEINPLHVAIHVCKLFFAKRRLEIAGRTEQHIFPIVAEDCLARAIPTISDSGLLFVGERVKIDTRHFVLFRARPDDPLTIRRPVVTLDLAVFVLIDQGHRLGCNIDITQSLQPVAPEQLLAVGRPFRRIVIGVGAARDLLWLAFAIL